MRLQPATRVTLRDTVIGGPDPVICLPLVAGSKAEVVCQAEELLQFDPDMVEWRIDGYDNVDDVADSLAALQGLREKIGDIPLLFTCRVEAEGGFKPIGADTRLKLMQAAIESGYLDIVDVELCNEAAFIERLKDAARHNGIRLILSYHNLGRTPDEKIICDKLVQAQEMGADIAKVAVMPQDVKDVLVLLNATLKARTEYLKIPIITMSMGPEGRVTRLAGGLFGSDLTFAIGKEASAAGQIPIGALRQAMDVLYGQTNRK